MRSQIIIYGNHYLLRYCPNSDSGWMYAISSALGFYFGRAFPSLFPQHLSFPSRSAHVKCARNGSSAFRFICMTICILAISSGSFFSLHSVVSVVFISTLRHHLKHAPRLHKMHISYAIKKTLLSGTEFDILFILDSRYNHKAHLIKKKC